MPHTLPRTQADIDLEILQIVDTIQLLLQKAARLHGNDYPSDWRRPAAIAVAITRRLQKEHAERAAVSTYQTCIEAGVAWELLASEEHSQFDAIEHALNDLASHEKASETAKTNAMGIVRAYHAALLKDFRAARHCYRCGDPIVGADLLCHTCRQNRAAMRVMRDPAMPEGDRQ